MLENILRYPRFIFSAFHGSPPRLVGIITKGDSVITIIVLVVHDRRSISGLSDEAGDTTLLVRYTAVLGIIWRCLAEHWWR